MKRFKTALVQFEGWRFYLLYALVALIFGFFIYRLYDYQVTNYELYQNQADTNRTSVINIPSQRGMILDRNGIVLARNIPTYNVTVTPAYLPDDEGATQEIFRQLSVLLDIPINYGDLEAESKFFTPCVTELGIYEMVFIMRTNWPYQATALKCNVSKDIAMIITEKGEDFQGIGITIEPYREYPTGWQTSEIIGFLGPIPEERKAEFEAKGFVVRRDKMGYAGIEYSMNEILAGSNGLRVVEVNVGGEVLRDLETPIDPVAGKDVYLSIDMRLQQAAKHALIGDIELWNTWKGSTMSSNGVAIAINPKTGEVLAMVSYPTYENNRMTGRYIPYDYILQLYDDPYKPLINHAISAEHPPGSVFKLAPALGILNEGVVTPEQTVDCAGKIIINQKYYENDPGQPREYVCWDENGHGLVNFLWGIALSCDVYWYKVGGGYGTEVPEGLGMWRMAEYAKAVGYGMLSGIELPGEGEGIIPNPTWKRITQGENWSTGDTYITTMGQGYILATPLQVVNSIATIANGGKLMQPTVIKRIVDSDGSLVPTFSLQDQTTVRTVGPNEIWDITVDPVINVYDGNQQTGDTKTIEPWILKLAQEGMRMVVAANEGEPFIGTAYNQFVGDDNLVAGKTGTAEYCDQIAQALDVCKPGLWPAHAWFVGYAPYDDPEIVVVAFVYNGKEGSSVGAPIVRSIIDAYFELKAIDAQ